MKIGLIGYGRMGHEIETIAVKRGHVVSLIIDVDNAADLNASKLKGIDVIIEFSSPDAAYENVIKCLQNSVPVVSGTTGWGDKYSMAADICKKHNTSFIHSTNYSIGVNLLFKLNGDLAKQMERFGGYQVAIEEIHHTKKLDAPSGTAITLAEAIIKNNSAYTGWSNEDENCSGNIPVTSIREGMVPGTHTVTWNSEIDIISLRHEALNRKGFALGAVVAAEFIHNKQGVFTMNDVMGF